jgi:glutamine amidotransferase
VSARIGIVNYGMGNLRSVEKAIEHVGGVAAISGKPAELASCDGLILPGVGAFPRAMDRIRESGLDTMIRERSAAGVPLFGICLGMQLLFESSSELGGSEGLGLLAGKVEPLPAVAGLKLPHIGWAKMTQERASELTIGIADGEAFYFVHSFAPVSTDEELIGSALYGERFAALVGRERIFGAQFHPEKSSTAGLRMLADFIALCDPAAVAGGAGTGAGKEVGNG